MTVLFMLMRRSILLASSFAAVLVVIGGAGWAIWRGADNARRQVSTLHSDHFRAGNALASIRANVFLNGILIRDILLDPDASNTTRYNDQFRQLREDTERSFAVLTASGISKEGRARLAQLQLEVDTYLQPTSILLNWTAREKLARRAEFLKERPRHRKEIVELAEQVEQLITTNFSVEQTRITNANMQFESSLIWTNGIALLLAMGIAGVTVTTVVTLERRSSAADAELRKLSGQLRMAQEQERKYLSRELHDQAGQVLTGLRMELASISHEAGPAEFSERIAHAKGLAEQTLRVIRNIAMLLRPSMLDDLGLVSALGWLVRDTERAGGTEIHSDFDTALDSLPDAQCMCVYRVVQEALTNTTRHAAAHRVDVTLSSNAQGITGRIVDDGRGFEPAGVRRISLGLAGMEERVRELGGTLRFVSSPGRGTRVEFHLPPTLEAGGAGESAG